MLILWLTDPCSYLVRWLTKKFKLDAMHSRSFTKEIQNEHFLILHGLCIDCIWTGYGLCMNLTWTINGLQMDCTVYVQYMDCIWTGYGLCMDRIWSVYRQEIDCIWMVYGLDMVCVWTGYGLDTELTKN